MSLVSLFFVTTSNKITDKIILKFEMVVSTRKSRTEESHLRVSLELVPQPLEITVTTTDARFFDSENRQICLKPKQSKQSKQPKQSNSKSKSWLL